jgi:hypothetical protein
MTVMFWLLLTAIARHLTHDAVGGSDSPERGHANVGDAVHAPSRPVHVSEGSSFHAIRIRTRRALATGSLIAAAAAVLSLAAVHETRMALADLRYSQALDAQAAGDIAVAKYALDDARSLAPQESEYAVAAGDLAYDNSTSPAIDRIARHYYADAARLGTPYPYVYVRLATLDEELDDDHGAALDAARTAVSLNQFDPAARALLAQLGG